MSGGSFNYLYCADSLADALEQRDDVVRMADALGQAGFASAEEGTRAILREIDEASRRIASLMAEIRPVWKAMEMVRSCDWGANDLDRAARDYANRVSDPADDR